MKARIKIAEARTPDGGEMALVHLLRALDFRAFGGEFFFEALDDFLCAVFLAFEIEDEESFVTVFHMILVW